MASDTRSDTELVFAARGPNPLAFNTLFERWFPRAWNVARNILRDDNLASESARQAVLEAWQRLDELDNVDSFGGRLLRIARNRALEVSEGEQHFRASNDETVSGLRDSGGFDPTATDRVGQSDQVLDAHEQQELVWDVSAALGTNDASLLDLHLRHGLSVAEIAQELGVSANTAHQQLFRLRGTLGKAVTSYLLWRHGQPLCEGLASAVSGSIAFDQSVSQAVIRHGTTCSTCARDRKSLVSPAKLFSSAPLPVVPPYLQTRAAAALAEVGVPVRVDNVNAEPGQSASEQPVTNHGAPDHNHETSSESEPGANAPESDAVTGRPILEQTHRLRPEFQETVVIPGPSRWNSRLLVGASGGAACIALIGSILFLAFGFGDDGLAIETNLAVAPSDDESALAPGASNSQDSAARSGDSAASTLDPTDFLTPPPSPAPAGPQADQPTPTLDDQANGSTTSATSPGTSSTTNLSTTAPSSTNTLPTPTSIPSTATSTATSTVTSTVTSTETSTNPSTGPSSSRPSAPPTSPSSGSTQTSRPTSPTSPTVTVPSTIRPTVSPTSPPSSPTSPPSVSVPTVTAPPTRPTTSQPAVARPEIERFLSTRVGSPDCGPGQAYLARWSALNTDSVTLITPDGSFNGDATGQQRFCGTPGDTIELVANGPGGNANVSIELL